MPILGISFLTGFVEEVIFRGLIFRLSEELLGTWFALAGSALFFGLAHAGNPGATLASSVAIALEAGILLGAAFLLTRRLWLVTSLHAAWNFTQGGIFGVAVSGNQIRGLLQGQLSGPEWISGGSFGAEASVVAVIVCLTAGVLLLVRASRNGQIVRPRWAPRAISSNAM